MTLEEFIDVLSEQFDETEKSEFCPETKYKELDDWSSLTSLSIIAMVDEECDIFLSSDVFKSSETIEELYNKIFK